MMVLDNSVVIDLLLQTADAPALEERVFVAGLSLHSPHLLDPEVAQVLRRYYRSNALTGARGEQALEDLQAMPLHRHRHDLLLSYSWELRDHVTAYDAAYLALAQGLGATLLTRDRRLAAVPLRGLPIELI